MNRFGLTALAAVVMAFPSAAGTADYHHVHLASPNVPEAVQWCMRDAPGLFKLGFVEDPWGTRVEVVQPKA
jgi:hypothetical protein